MRHTATPDTLTITITEAERAELRELRDEKPETFGSDSTMAEFLEPLTANSELSWLPEGATGDLTSAPMLGILGKEMAEPVPAESRGYGLVQIGQWDGKRQFSAIVERWAWMNYAVQSLLDALLNDGEAVLVASN